MVVRMATTHQTTLLSKYHLMTIPLQSGNSGTLLRRLLSLRRPSCHALPVLILHGNNLIHQIQTQLHHLER